MLKTNRPGLPGRRWAALIVLALSPLPRSARRCWTGERWGSVRTHGRSRSSGQDADQRCRPIAGTLSTCGSAYGPDGSPDGNGPAVVGRRFDRFGDALGPAFLINSYTTGAQERPRVAFDGQGRFVVTWAGCCASAGVFGQRFESSGAPIGAEFTVTQSPWNFLAAHSLAVAPSGAFIVAWDGMDGNGSGIMARRFDQNGSPLGPEFQVNTYTTAMQQKPAIAFAGDDDPSSSSMRVSTAPRVRHRRPGVFCRRVTRSARSSWPMPPPSPAQVTPAVASVGMAGSW